MNINTGSRRGFTVVELLIVVGVLLILTIAAIYFVNPSSLQSQGRDTNRVSDLTTLNQNVALYHETQPASSLGATGLLYISIPDPTATSTAGDQCQGLGLSTSSLPIGYTYHCAATSTYRNTNGTGWIPVNFAAVSSIIIPSLPVDPVNTTSSGDYYEYIASGTQYELIANPESPKTSSSSLEQGNNLLLFALGATVTYTTSTYSTPSRATQLAFDPHTNTIWVEEDNNIQVINDTTYTSTTLPFTSGGDLVFDPHTNTMWTSGAYPNYGVIEINDTTYASTTHISPIENWRLTFDSHTNTIWVPNENTGAVTVINDTTYATSTYSTNSTTTYPDQIAFDSHTNTVWLAGGGSGCSGCSDAWQSVTEINDTTFTENHYYLGYQTYGLVFDPHTNTMWSTDDGVMIGINDITYATTTVSGTEIEHNAFDSHTNSIWTNGYNRPDSLAQVNDTTYALTDYSDPGLSIDGIAFDSHTNTIWTANGSYGVAEFTPNK